GREVVGLDEDGLRGEGVDGAFRSGQAGVGVVGNDGGERVVAAEGEEGFGVGDDDALLVDSGCDVNHGGGRGGIDGGLHGGEGAIGGDGGERAGGGGAPASRAACTVAKRPLGPTVSSGPAAAREEENNKKVRTFIWQVLQAGTSELRSDAPGGA